MGNLRGLWLLIWLLPGLSLLAQEPSAPGDTTDSKWVQIRNADLLVFVRIEGEGVQKLLGNVQLQQDSTLFFCDSAYFYEQTNRFDAFDRVRVEMPDSVVMRSKRLSYDGNTRIAEVYDDISLVNREVSLTTQRLTYYRDEEYGYYQQGGKLVDGESVLTSETGYYYPREDQAYFRRKVVLENPDYTLHTDTLGYNTDSKVARFLTFTRIDSKDGEIETTQGTYDTGASRIDLYARSVVRDSSYILTADTLTYIDQDNLGFAYGHIVILQDDSTLEIRGNYGRFNRRTDESLVTRDAVGIQRFDDDTLYIFADTLLFREEQRIRQRRAAATDTLEADTVGSDSLADSLPPVAPPVVLDTFDARIFLAYHQVRYFMNDMQGRADSMTYFYDDSTIYLYDDPVLWSDQNQLSGDTIKVWMKNRQADSLWVGMGGFLVSQEDTVGFNQMKGRELRAKFRDNELVRLDVLGNAESIYFIRDDKDTARVSYQGMNQATAQSMILHLKDNEVKRIVFRSKPEGTFYPFFEVVDQENRLEGMRWRIQERPEKPALFAPQTTSAATDPPVPGTER
ncbi:MAG: OstA-like protein [Bacteroidia bacterium]